MRHRCATKNLGRAPAHRKAMLRNLAINLFEHGRIRTTVQKAKSARRLVERIVSLGKDGSLSARRLALAELGGTLAAKRAVKRVFGEIAKRYAGRPGGCTRIVRLPETIRLSSNDASKIGKLRRSRFFGLRQGDNARMVIFELVEAEPPPKGKKRSKLPGRTTKRMRGEMEKEGDRAKAAPADAGGNVEKKPSESPSAAGDSTAQAAGGVPEPSAAAAPTDRAPDSPAPQDTQPKPEGGGSGP
ncbi:MAG: 50S ribosomal protein L17 [Planctomycetota bacterium]|nr:50S ribosomal protein L17 [Planctomycetota bacterium]